MRFSQWSTPFNIQNLAITCDVLIILSSVIVPACLLTLYYKRFIGRPLGPFVTCLSVLMAIVTAHRISDIMVFVDPTRWVPVHIWIEVALATTSVFTALAMAWRTRHVLTHPLSIQSDLEAMLRDMRQSVEAAHESERAVFRQRRRI